MYMFKYVLKRIGLMIMTFCIIMFISFVLIKLLPLSVKITPGQDGNIFYFRLRDRGYITNLKYNEFGNVYDFDYVPILVQLGYYLQRIFLYGDFGIGTTMYESLNVWDVFVKKLPPTILINIYSSLIGVPIGLGLGIFAALKKNKWQDQIINVVIILLISLPSIVLGVIIQYVFCYKLDWFPLTMADPAEYSYLSWTMFHSMMPAVFALALGPVAGYARGTRAELSEVLTNEFMLLARTKGLTRGQATLRHALRNSMVVILPSILAEFISVLSGSLVIEKMFSIPGVGGLFLDAINFKDYDFFMFLSGFYTLVGLTANIFLDISYGFIDPRIKMGAR